MTQAPKDHPLHFSSLPLQRAKTLATHTRSVAWAARGRRDPHDGLRILFYHRIADEPDPLAVRVDRFREQMESLAEQGFRVLDVVAATRTLTQQRGAQYPGGPGERVIGLSFDAGCLDVARNALPGCEKRGSSPPPSALLGAVAGTATFGWYE